MNQKHSEISFSTLVQEFFCQCLMAQRNASGQTIASYRDTFRLLFQYTQKITGKAPATLELTDLDANLILGFLDHLEKERGNSVRSRNARLAAIRSFMHYASYKNPCSLSTIQQVLAIPMKRYDQPMLAFLSREEVEAIISAGNKTIWSGHRDSVMFLTLYNTAARVSEIINLKVADVSFGNGSSIHIHGKGRKQRTVPLWKSTATRLKEWLARLKPMANSPLFPNRNSDPLSRSGVEYRLRVAIQKAAKRCETLKNRHISPHIFRHTTAMHLLQSGIDITVIALWLGHESPSTTHMYIEADLSMKEQALKKLQGPSLKGLRYKASDSILNFLESL